MTATATATTTDAKADLLRKYEKALKAAGKTPAFDGRIKVVAEKTAGDKVAEKIAASLGVKKPRPSGDRPPTKWYDVLDVLLEKDGLPSRILMYGPPGTGKSSWGVRKRAGLRTPPLTPNMGAEQLIGTFILDRGNTVWVDGPVTLAMRKGQTVVIDEIDKAGPEIIAVLHGVLDDPEIAEIMLPQIDPVTGDPVRVRPAKGFCVIATTNEPPQFIQPESLADRFELVLHCPCPSPDALNGLPPEARRVLDSAYAKKKSEAEWAPEISMRRVLAWHRMAETTGDKDWAAELVFGPRVGKEFISCLASGAK